MDDKQKKIVKLSIAGGILVLAAVIFIVQMTGGDDAKVNPKTGQAVDALTSDLAKKQQAADAKRPPPPDPEPDMPAGGKRKAIPPK